MTANNKCYYKIMKNLFLSLIVFICGQNVFAQGDIRSKLTILEKSLSSLNEDESKYTIENVSNSNNRYDDYGRSTYNRFETIDNFLKGFKVKPNYEKDVKPFIENQIKQIEPYNIDFSGDVKLIYDSYTKSMKYKSSIQISKAYENFISENYSDQSKIKDLLQVISNTKYSTFKAKGKKKTFSIREQCANNCMQDMFEGFNPIQWAEFAVGFLGGSLFWAYGSCWYDCW